MAVASIATAALIQPLTWELPYATGVAGKGKRKRKKEGRKERTNKGKREEVKEEKKDRLRIGK